MFAICLALFGAQAQDAPTSPKQELEQLRKELDDVKKKLKEGVREQDLEKLEERLEQRFKALERQLDAVSRTAAGTALNPKITAFIDLAGRWDNRPLTVDPADPTSDRLDNNVYLRTVELDFRAAVDPYADAVLIVAIEGLAGGEFEVDVEEGYALIKQLPFLERMPLGLKIKAGKFRPPFGVSNRLHLHDMPHASRPLAVARYLGSEQGDFFEAGLSAVGGEFDLLLPVLPIEGPVMTLQIDLLRAGDTGLADTDPAAPSPAQPAYLVHLDVFLPLDGEHKLSVGASGYWERGSLEKTLYGIDVTYTWRPLEAGQEHSIVAGAELFFGDRHFLDASSMPAHAAPFGFYAYLQGQILRPVYLGVRYDYVQDVSDPSLLTQAISVYVSYYTSEFLRIRVGYERRWSDRASENRVDTILIELNIVFGSHPVEPYWVNR